MTENRSINSIQTTQSTNKMLDTINTIVLFIYPMLVALEFRRYISSNPGNSLTDIFLALEFALLVISLIKIVIFFKTNPVFSVGSLIFIASSVYYHLYKFDFEWRFFLTSMPVLLTMSVMMISMYKIPFDKIIKAFIITVGTLFVIRILGAATKILPSERYNQLNRSDIWDLGFGHYNTPLMYFFFICLSWMYLIRSRRNYILNAIFMGVFTLILYRITTSRTATIVLILGVIALITLSVLRLRSFTALGKILLPVYRVVMASLPLALTVVSFGSTLILNHYITKNGFPQKWSTMYERFVNFNDDCAMNGVHLPWSYYADAEYSQLKYNWFFGGVSQSNYSDNLIQTLLISYGFIILLVFIGLMTVWAIRSVKQKNDINLLIIGLISVLSAMQPHAFLYGWNPFLMLPFAIWGDSEPALRAQKADIYLPLKDRIKIFTDKISDRRKRLTPFFVVYIIATMAFAVIVAYQMLTNVVSDYFFWWMILTVYMLLVFFMILAAPVKDTQSDESIVSYRRFIVTYGPRIALMLLIFMAGCFGIISTVLSSSEYELDIQDPRISDEGLVLNVHPDFRQIIKSEKSGLKRVSLYLSDYSDNVSEFGLSFVTTNGQNGTAGVYKPSDYADKGVITIDTSGGSFREGDICVLALYDINNGQFDYPVLEKITYTYVNDVDFKGLAFMAVPVLLAMINAWFIGATLNSLLHKDED